MINTHKQIIHTCDFRCTHLSDIFNIFYYIYKFISIYNFVFHTINYSCISYFTPLIRFNSNSIIIQINWVQHTPVFVYRDIISSFRTLVYIISNSITINVFLSIRTSVFIHCFSTWGF